MSVQQELFQKSLKEVLVAEEKLKIEKSLAIDNAFKSNDIDEIYTASSYLKKIEQREEATPKSMLVDPMELSASFGYKDKPFRLSYQVLRAMAATPIVKAIIETRKEEVRSFCEPQREKFSTGFTIQKKSKFSAVKKEVKLSRQDENRIEEMIQFLMNCGNEESKWTGDTFDDFITKLVVDSLTFDQACFEVKRNNKGEVIGFFAVDGATFRISETFSDTEEDTKYPDKVVQGYLPAYVQLYMNKPHAEFYPWELCFGIRNPQSDIRYNGYGKSELEDMVQTVTALLNSDTYNANFFKVGSAPKGILKYSGDVNQNSLEDFRRQWMAQVSGVLNAHKIPMINADKMDFVSTHIPNKDMEYSKYQEFLIKVTCAIFKIDPAQIGFPMSGNSQGTSGLGGSDHEEKIQASKDKGLKPLLKKIQYWLNKYIVQEKDPELELRFVGLDEGDEVSDLENDVTMLQNFMTFNEIRGKKNLEPLEFGDIPANPVYLQAQQAAAQAEQQNQQMEQQGQQDEQDRNDEQEQQAQDDEEEYPFGSVNIEDEESDDFKKSLMDELANLLNS